MFKRNNSKIVRLANQYTLKGSDSEKFLFNLWNRDKFILDAEQYLFLTLCNGKNRLSEIIDKFDPDSQKIALKFVKKLRKEGVIEFRDTILVRELPKLAPIPQLQSIHFELTSKCNMKCKHCYQESYLKKPTDLSLPEIRKIVRQMRLLNVEKVGISGGEPFLRPDLFKIIRILEENEIAISSILTNGLLLNKKMVKKILSCKRQFPLFVSLDGINPRSLILRGVEINSSVDTYQKLIENIQHAIKSGIPIMINTVVTRDNIDDLCEMYDMLREMKVTGWRIALPKNAGAFTKHNSEFSLPRKTVFKKYLEIIKKHLEKDDWKSNNFHLQIEHFFRLEAFENLKPLPLTAFVCDYEGKHQSCCIKPNGDVTPCPLYINLPMGNIRNQPLEGIWYSKRMQKIKNVCIGDIEECKSCELNSLCATGCRANAVFLHGSSNAKDDDACEAVNFFVTEVIPLLNKKNMGMPGIKKWSEDK